MCKSYYCANLILLLFLGNVNTRTTPKLELNYPSYNEIMKAIDDQHNVFSKSDCIRFYEEGPSCYGSISVYYWNNDNQRCETGYYGGCGKTKNNFQNYYECNDIAGSLCRRKKLFEWE